MRRLQHDGLGINRPLTNAAYQGRRDSGSHRPTHRKSSTSISSSTDESIREKNTVRPSRDALRPGPTVPRLRATVVDRREEKWKYCSRVSPAGRSAKKPPASPDSRSM